MAQITSYSQLYPFVLRWLPGCELPAILRALQDGARYICEVYEVWKEDLDPQPIVDWQQDYTLSLPSPDPLNTVNPYLAAIHRIDEVKVNGQVFEYPMYEFLNESVLRFESSSVPHGLDNRMLVCGNVGTSSVANWQLLTDASVGVSISTGTYALTNLNFTGLSFNQIALKIQTAIRQSINGNIGYCRWYQNKFKLWADNSTLSYLPAGSSGTDISGATWMNGKTGVGTLGALLQVKAVLRPQQTVATLPDWLLDRISDALIARAIWQIKQMPGPMKDKEGAVIWDFEFKNQITNIIGEKNRTYKGGVRSMEA